MMQDKMTETQLVFLIILLLVLSRSQVSVSDEFIFNGFKGAGNNLILNGIAEIDHNGLLQLTNDSARLLGHAFYDTPIKFKNSTNGKAVSFSTAFAFFIVPEYERLGGHGLAFTISKSKELKDALPSQYLGLMNASDVGNFSNYVFAVEFDTVQDFEFGDINDNHIGIDINSLVSNASVNASCFDRGNSIKEKINLKGGSVIQAWIDYDSTRQELDVTLSSSSSKPSVSILSLPVDLSSILLDHMYVGFSASTGLLASYHYISGWSFSTNGQAQSLDLSSLPTRPGPKQTRKVGLILGTSVSAVAVLTLVIATSLYTIKKIKNRDVVEAWEYDVGPHRYSYRELKKATKCFRDKELLGFGGFGKVYKGTLLNSGTEIAVKRINHESKQGLREFMSEIASIGRLRHRNLVPLLGWCRHRADLLLVYEFMPNGSLDKYIFDDPKTVLTWDQRVKIIKGVASGLLYLHEEWEQTVIHRDVKAANVLLDSEMNANLGDFGLAKLYEHGSNPSTTKVVGTLGYLAPELTKTGKPTTSSDVFAFGALLLEVACGRKPIEPKALPEELILVDWVWDKWRDGTVLEVIDPRLNGEYNEVEALAVIKLGLICSDNSPRRRPSMRRVVGYLDGEEALLQVLADNDDERGHEIEDRFGFEDSYPSSSNCEKVTVRDVDLEAGSTPPPSASCGVD